LFPFLEKPIKGALIGTNHQRSISYLINGIVIDSEVVMKKDPLKRTISEWLSLVDWDLHRLQPYVVVDPLNPSELLYMNKPEYLSVWKVAGSRDLPFIVIAGPTTAQPAKSTDPNISISSNENQNSPWDWRLDSISNKKSTLSWEIFCNFKRTLHTLLPKTLKEKGLVAADVNSIGRSLYLWARELAHYAEMRKPSEILDLITPLVLYIERLYTNNGAPYAIAAFKVMLFTLYSYMMGTPLRNTDPLGTRIALRNGLPKAWGPQIRNFVRKGDLKIIRILASLLNIYRALDAEHPEPSVKTIIQPHPNFEENLIFHQFRRFCEDHWPVLLGDHINDGKGENLPYFRYTSQVGLNIRKAGANGSSAMASLDLDARALELHGKTHVRDWFTLHNDTEALFLLDEVSKDHHWGRPHLERFYTTERVSGMNASRLFLATRNYGSKGLRVEPPLDVKDPGIPGPILGRLHPIPEAAGKVRVVAIVDYFTQIAMKPVHAHLLSLLKKIKTDATFDQSGVVTAYYNAGHSRHWSYDLKAATDLIPRALYLEVLAPLLVAPSDQTGGDARKRAELWVDVMSDRNFLSPSKDAWVKYGTGLPMGAYSHWASMALVHHALVQFAWYRVNGQRLSWYMLYLILGDDLDIAKYPRVAEEYLAICNAFGIQIGLHKSLQSNLNAFEFANRRFTPAGDISPLSIKEELAATSWSQRVEYSKRILERMGTSLKNSALAQVRKMVTFSGWKVLKAELAGLRNTAFLPTIRFVAGNPFRELKWNIPIETLVNWVLLLLPVKEAKEVRKLTTATMFGNNAVVSPNPREAFIAVLYTELAKSLCKSLARRRESTARGFLGFRFSRKDPDYRRHLSESIRRAPQEMFFDLGERLGQSKNHKEIMYLNNYFSDYTWASYQKRLQAVTGGLTPTERRLGSYASIVYMFWVSYCHNFWLDHKVMLLQTYLDPILESIEFEWDKNLNRTTLNFEDPIEDAADDLYAAQIRNLFKEEFCEGETPPRTIGEFLNWMYISYLSLPDALIIDLSQSMDTWNNPDPIDKTGVSIESHKGKVTSVTIKDLGEALKGPLGALVSGFTKGTGCTIPPIPKTSLLSSQKVLEAGVEYYRNYIEAPPRRPQMGIFFDSVFF
jgi:hypothetical protein